MVSATIENIRWNDTRTGWLMENAAIGLGREPPPPGTEEFEWVTGAFPDSSAMTLYLAARALADAGKLLEALEVLGDACRAQRSARPTLRKTPSARPPSMDSELPSGIRVTRPSFQ
jgi:hypothetical protein